MNMQYIAFDISFLILLNFNKKQKALDKTAVQVIQ